MYKSFSHSALCLNNSIAVGRQINAEGNDRSDKTAYNHSTPIVMQQHNWIHFFKFLSALHSCVSNLK